MSALSIKTPFSNSATSQSGWFGSFPLLPAETRISYETFVVSSIIYSKFPQSVCAQAVNSNSAIMTHPVQGCNRLRYHRSRKTNVVISKTEKKSRGFAAGRDRRPAERRQVNSI